MTFPDAASSLLLFLLAAACAGQTPQGTVPAGTPLALATDQNIPMRISAQVRGRLLYPVYADNVLLLPKDTLVEGTVVALHADRSRRTNALLGGDFTPFRIPEVHFTAFVLNDGTRLPFASESAINGTPIYRAVAPPPAKGGMFRQQFDSGLTAGRSDLAAFLAPGKGDRLLQFLYSQLPYHPQRIAKGTSWTVETTSAITVPAELAPALAVIPPPARKPHFWEVQPPGPETRVEGSGAWVVQANLQETISSEKSASGQPIRASVAEPVYGPDHTIAVPQGAILVGSITRAKHSRRFGRTGELSFNFNQLILPDTAPQTVETRLTGADSAPNIALNSEGQAKSKPQDKIAIPLLLALMASRPLDQDHQERRVGHNAAGGAAGFGLIGTVVGMAGGSPYAAAGIGYWGAARAVYSRWIGRGQKIVFARDTRIVVETTPRRSAPIKPDLAPAP